MTALAPAQLKHELIAIKNYLTAAQDVLNSGHMPDMTGLESRVAVLCAALQSTDAETQKECLPELSSILNALTSCEETMRGRFADQLEAGKTK